MRLASGGFCCNPYVSEYLWVVVAVPGCEARLIMSQHQRKLNNIFSVRSTPRHSDHDPHPGTRISHANRAECAPPTTPRLSCQASVSPLQLRPLEFRRRAWPPALPPPTPDAQHPTSMRRHNAQPHPATDTPSHCHLHTRSHADPSTYLLVQNSAVRAAPGAIHSPRARLVQAAVSQTRRHEAPPQRRAVRRSTGRQRARRNHTSAPRIVSFRRLAADVSDGSVPQGRRHDQAGGGAQLAPPAAHRERWLRALLAQQLYHVGQAAVRARRQGSCLRTHRPTQAHTGTQTHTDAYIDEQRPHTL